MAAMSHHLGIDISTPRWAWVERSNLLCLGSKRGLKGTQSHHNCWIMCS